MSIKKEIIKMIEQRKRTALRVKGGSNLYTDLGFDSLLYINFLLRLEEKFGLSFSLADTEKCLKVRRLIKTVKKRGINFVD